MKYFVKSRFTGWQEVAEQNYRDFIKNIKASATAMSDEEKQRLVEKVTRTEGGC